MYCMISKGKLQVTHCCMYRNPDHECRLSGWLCMMALLILTVACSADSPQGPGTYAFDRQLIDQAGLTVVELTDASGLARVLIVPEYQGRVMTSTSAGLAGRSYGWMNHELIASGEPQAQFHAFGGEERFWLGPEGGPFSLYFAPGVEQRFEYWQVPALIDTEPFAVLEHTSHSVRFGRTAELTNAAGTVFELGIDRELRLLDATEVSQTLGSAVPEGLALVAYESVNTVQNRGSFAWNEQTGMPSIWMLSHFVPSEQTTVFIPYRTDASGVVVNDEYFGKVPEDRLIVRDGIIWFRADGAYRSKIGVPPQRATDFSGAWDPQRQVLTLVWSPVPEGQYRYVNSNWGEQDNPFDGDLINAYNDGPLEDGSLLGPFYELETSSPALELGPGESGTHVQRIMHFEGDPAYIDRLIGALFGLSTRQIGSVF